MGKQTIYLPDFIIIGANKAGTTSIANYLNENPKIKISDVKEPMFFASTPMTSTAKKESATLEKPYFAVTLQEYSSMYENHYLRAKIYGEASTAYLACPSSSVIPMKKIVPDVKIIAVLREPVSRAISAYKMCLGNGIEDRSFSEVVQDASSQKTILNAGHGVKEYIRNGLYAQLLAPYIKYYDKSQILIMNYDELKNNPDTFMQKISNFIGVDYHAVDFEQKYNVESDHIKDDVVIKAEDIKILKKHYFEELTQLQDMLDFDISDWMK